MINTEQIRAVSLKYTMRRPYTFIVPTSEKKNDICAVVHHSSKVLTRDHRVIQYQFSEMRSWLHHSQKKQNDSTHNWRIWQPIAVVPGLRFSSIQKLNHHLNYLFLQCRELLFGHQPVLWVTKPQFSLFLSSTLPTTKIWFDIFDFIWTDTKKPLTKQLNHVKKILEKSDLITAISSTLKKEYQKIHNRPIQIVPQGFEEKIFYSYTPQKKKRASKKPIIGFVGGISQRLDIELLNEVVTANSNCLFRLIGPIQNSKHDDQNTFESSITQLLSHKNVEHINQVDQSQLPEYMDQFDICIIPYDLSDPFNKLSYPMKIFEYFYQGKPVISTPITELQQNFNKLMFFGETASEWNAHISIIRSTSWPKSKQEEQKQLALENSWQSKISEILKVL